MSGPIKLKSGVVPHIFTCQSNRKRTTDQSLSVVSEKRRHKAEIAVILATSSLLPDTTVKENITPNILTKQRSNLQRSKIQTYC